MSISSPSNPLLATYSDQPQAFTLNMSETDDLSCAIQDLTASTGKKNKKVFYIRFSPATHSCGSIKRFQVSLFNNGRDICRAGANPLRNPFLKSVYPELIKFFNHKIYHTAFVSIEKRDTK